jgi:hypothetical protein
VELKSDDVSMSYGGNEFLSAVRDAEHAFFPRRLEMVGMHEVKIDASAYSPEYGMGYAKLDGIPPNVRNGFYNTLVEFAHLSRDEPESDSILPLLAVRSQQLHSEANTENGTTGRDEVVDRLVQSSLVQSPHRRVE